LNSVIQPGASFKARQNVQLNLRISANPLPHEKAIPLPVKHPVPFLKLPVSSSLHGVQTNLDLKTCFFIRAGSVSHQFERVTPRSVMMHAYGRLCQRLPVIVSRHRRDHPFCQLRLKKTQKATDGPVTKSGFTRHRT
jgi:hypothetical protein